MESLAGELEKAKANIKKLRRQRQCWKWISMILWNLLGLGVMLTIVVQISYSIEQEIKAKQIILAKIEVTKQNITGYDLTVWATKKLDKEKIENDTIGFWKWLEDNSTENDSVLYYMVRERKMKLQHTVKIKHWHDKAVEIFETNSYVEEQEDNETAKYFIGSTTRTTLDEELGGCWIVRLRTNFDLWNIDGCECTESVVRHKRSKIMRMQRRIDPLSTRINEWIKASKILNPEGEFVLLTSAKDRYIRRYGNNYVEKENYYETTMSLDFNKTLPWLWKVRMTLPRATYNQEKESWEVDNKEKPVDVYLIKMKINETLQTEQEIRNHYERETKLMDKCVREEIGKRKHGQKYYFTKNDYNDYSYSSPCDKYREKMDCVDFVNGTDPVTGNRTSKILSIKRKLHLRRVGLKPKKDKQGIYKLSLIYHKEETFGLPGRECAEMIKNCAERYDAITVNQISAVLCYWTYGIPILPWTFIRDQMSNRFKMTYGADGVVREIDERRNWEVFHTPSRIEENSLIRYNVPYG
ncbi:MAG: hypothetical protein ACRCZO_15050, partial [Cetobacterium sp.]